MTVHVHLLPPRLRQRILAHPTFKNALTDAIGDRDRDVLHRSSSELQRHMVACLILTEGALALRRQRPSHEVPHWCAEASRSALEGLAAACAHTLLHRRACALEEGLEAIRSSDRALAACVTDRHGVRLAPPLVSVGPPACAVPAPFTD
jgi:hypothetical protein